MNEWELARQWYQRVSGIQQGHYSAATHFHKRHVFLGSLNVILAAAVGTSVFATLATQSNLIVLTGALSVLSTLIAAMNTFLSYGERSDRHRVAGARYGVVGRELELYLAKNELQLEVLEHVRVQLDALAQECPHIPDIAHSKNRAAQNVGG